MKDEKKHQAHKEKQSFSIQSKPRKTINKKFPKKGFTLETTHTEITATINQSRKWLTKRRHTLEIQTLRPGGLKAPLYFEKYLSS